MALNTYTGKLTNFARYAVPEFTHREMYVEPVSAAFGPSGLMASIRQPVTVDEHGNFSIMLESSNATRPNAVYRIVAKWRHGENLVDSCQWIFVAPRKSGDIGELGAVNIGVDTDGVPYFNLGSWENQLLLDTDDVPYFSIGQ